MIGLLLSALACIPAPPPALPEPAPAAAPKAKPGAKLLLTDATTITLDGAAVKWADVPADAFVVGLEVAADKRTILRIAFKSHAKEP